MLHRVIGVFSFHFKSQHSCEIALAISHYYRMADNGAILTQFLLNSARCYILSTGRNNQILEPASDGHEPL